MAAVFLKHVAEMEKVFPAKLYYLSPEAVREAVLHQSSFNVIHHASMTKVDIMIRKQEEYRPEEFARREQTVLRGHQLWVVSKEDLILSKLDRARESLSERQLEDVKNQLATGCDESYLETWANKLNLTSMLTRATG